MLDQNTDQQIGDSSGMQTVQSPQPSAGGMPADGQSQLPETWNAFMEVQPEQIRALFESHEKGLKSAYEAEKRQRKDLEIQIKDLSSKMKVGSDERVQLEQVSAQLATASERADFFEEGARSEVGCTNLGLAWLAIQARKEDFVKRGRIDWPNFKAAYPQLFVSPAPPPGHAGTNTQAQPTAPSMNQMIRRAAGRQT